MDPGSHNDADPDADRDPTTLMQPHRNFLRIHRIILSGVLLSFGKPEECAIVTGSFVNAFFKREGRQSGFIIAISGQELQLLGPLKCLTLGELCAR